MSKYKWKGREKEYKKEHNKSHRKQHRKAEKKWRATHPEEHALRQKQHRQKYPERMIIYNLVNNHPERYPLNGYCIFCGSTEKLEHAHLDYEDEGVNYVTACHLCNSWMGCN